MLSGDTCGNGSLEAVQSAVSREVNDRGRAQLSTASDATRERDTDRQMTDPGNRHG